MKKIFLALLLAMIFFIPADTFAADKWFWLDSNDKYSKYFEPDSVTINKKVVTNDGREIAIEIEAWTKTTYSYDGAAETIKNYGISNILPDPNSLAYSLALLRVNPQNRTLQYVREDFYNAQDQVVWSKEEGRIKEINTRSFDEEFYCAIVDEVFQMGERDRKIYGLIPTAKAQRQPFPPIQRLCALKVPILSCGSGKSQKIRGDKLRKFVS